MPLIDSIPPHVWDPAGRLIDPSLLRLRNGNFKAGPSKKVSLILLGLILTVLGIKAVLSRDLALGITVCISAYVFSGMPGFHRLTGKSQSEATSLQRVVETSGWLFERNATTNGLSVLGARYPEILRWYGQRLLGNQIWGSLIENGETWPFWMADVDNGHRLYETVIAIRLIRPVATTLSMGPEGGQPILNAVQDWAEGDTILESPEFNKAFRVRHYMNMAPDKEAFKILNPAVMSALLDAYAAYGRMCVLFKGSAVFFRLERRFLTDKISPALPQDLAKAFVRVASAVD